MPQSIIRGDTQYWIIELHDEDDDPMDLTGCTLWFTAKAAATNVLDDSDAIIAHYIVIGPSGDVVSAEGLTLGGVRPSDGVLVTGPTGGVLTQSLSADETTVLSGSMTWDIQIKEANNDITTLLSDTITIVADITRRTTTP